ncbi:hypothetical protein B4U79_00829 [Dinothrombium tinctorium]|uniref:ABC transmembrane type-1 domain-containing protein n=1 Tax=Dinothrombium tinctorium TaxID=1965070 RepID=A0A3S3PBR4_9ACAR|nr:hypothetical protein B4U79_00829 [Dinothrombium tinctorium]
MCSELKSERMSKMFDSCKEKYRRNSREGSKNINLFFILWSLGKYPFCGGIFLELLDIVFTYISPLLLGAMIGFLTSKEPLWHGIVLGIGFSLTSLLAQLCGSHHEYFLELSGVRIKSALMSAVYKKMFKLSSGARREYIAGDISNLLSIDTEEVFECILWLPQIIGLPLRIAISFYILWRYLGIFTFSIFGVLLILGPISTLVSNKLNKLQEEQMELKDKRVSQISELLNGIKVWKLYAWEKLFLKKISDTREAELKNILITSFLSSIFAILWNMSSSILACVCFSLYILFNDNDLMTAKTVFVSLSVFELLRYPTSFLPDVITKIIRARVSYLRLRDFLIAEESDVQCIGNTIDESNLAIKIENCSFSWSKDGASALNELNFNIEKGTLVAIVGSVGSVDKIIILKDGHIEAEGTYGELSARGYLDFAPDEEKNDFESADKFDKKDTTFVSTSITSPRRLRRRSTLVSESSSEGALVEEEIHEVGEIHISLYLKYFKKAGVFIVVLTFLSYVGSCGCDFGANFWLSIWTDQPLSVLKNSKDREFRLYIYWAIIATEALFVLMSSIAGFYGGVNASRIFHREMLLSVLRSPLSFFDVTPAGRIINRFSKDILTVDFDIPWSLNELINCYISLVIIFAVISFSSPYFIFGLFIFGLLYYILYKLYIRTSRQLKHLESISNSPVYNHFNGSIYGSATIRAFGVEQFFIQKSYENINENLICYYYQQSAVRWLEIWMEFIGVFIIFTISLIVLLDRDKFYPGFAALILTYSTQIIASFAWLVRLASDAETHMVATERINEYSNLQAEAEWNFFERKPDIHWPRAGRIEFENYSTSIIVLFDGRIVEAGTPSELLSNKDSNFYAMAQEAGLVS